MIKSFLTDRYQTVVVNGSASPSTKVLSGVPQGSVLGPLLFLVLIGDIDEKVKSSFVSSFADDTRIGRKIKDSSDVQALQDDLDAIYQWADDNNMQFNSGKFECIKYGRRKDLREASKYSTQDGKLIKTKDTVRDLGVTLDSDGTFTSQIDKVCSTARSLSSWILRTFKTRQKNLMLTLWKSLVLPHIDYCCQLWTPDRKGHIQALEAIQKSFLRKITGYSQLNYWQLLDTLNIKSIQRRQERYSIIYTWRMMENQVPNAGIQHHISKRCRRCVVPPLTSARDNWIRRLRCSLF